MSSALKLVKGALRSKSIDLLDHSMRTSFVAEAIAEAIKDDFCFDLTIQEIQTAGLLHDIGKLQICSDILDKEGPLSLVERQRIRYHPQLGSAIASSVQSLKKYSPYILQHHEKADGSGYPNELTLRQIDPISRIINIADQYSALIEKRSYCDAVDSADIVLAMLQGGIDAFFGKSADKVMDVIYYGISSFREIPPGTHLGVNEDTNYPMPMVIGGVH